MDRGGDWTSYSDQGIISLFAAVPFLTISTSPRTFKMSRNMKNFADF